MFRNSVLMLTTCVACLFAGEAASRLVFDPIDVLKVSLEDHSVLEFKIAANESGHDALGFRNKTPSNDIDVLAIGDSMTYGNMAPTDGSWPAHYAKISGKTVFNAGIGGYGPAQYLYNLKDLATKLTPETVIMTVYVGNDFLDTYNLVYGNKHWSGYRDPANSDIVETQILVNPSDLRFMGKPRDWLSQNSVIYRLATQSAVFDKARLKERQHDAPLSYIVKRNGNPVLLSQKSMEYTNYADPRIQEGFEISKRLITEAKTYCADNDIDFHVAIMPVKESIYVKALPDLFSNEDLSELAPFITNLDGLHTKLGAFLDAENIPHVDLTPALTEALKSADIYPAADGHPNSAGYEIAAKAMIEAFSATPTKSALNQ